MAGIGQNIVHRARMYDGFFIEAVFAYWAIVFPVDLPPLQ
jgi:hypothetical protein